MRFLLSLLILLSAAATGWAVNEVSAWAEIEALDSGPKRQPSSREEAVLLARNHLQIQKRSIETFLKTYPSSERVPSARLRLASILATEGNMDSNPKAVTAALKILASLEQDPATPPAIQADAAFRKASIVMQSANPSSPAGVKTIVDAAKTFAAKYPSDIRSPRLLTEAATVCDDQPALKKALLQDAKNSTSESGLIRRIDDDLTRLDLLGRTLEFSLPGLNGKTITSKDFQGRPLIIVFWSSEAPHSLLWLADFGREWLRLGAKAPAVLTVNLDDSKKEAELKAAEFPTHWKTAREEGGWKSPSARKWGINALPTVWFVDEQGVLQSLNAKTNWNRWISAGVGNSNP